MNVNTAIKFTRHNIFYGLIVAIAILFSLCVRGRLAEMPLERDEGEFAYTAQLIMDGGVPYKDVYNKKLPGMAYMYIGFIKLFGETRVGIRMGLAAVNICTILALFMLAKTIFDPFTGAIASLSYSVLSVDPMILGMAAHATQAINLFVVLSILVILKAIREGSSVYYLLSGFLLGLTFLLKQHALFFAPFSYLYVFVFFKIQKKDKPSCYMRAMSIYTLGMLLPLFGAIAVIVLAGTFDKFWFWSVIYAKGYVSRLSIAAGIARFNLKFGQVVNKFTFLWIMGSVGYLILLFTQRPIWKKIFISLFLFFSFACLIPGFILSSHYFIVLLPGICVCIGIAFSYIKDKVDRFSGKGWGGAVAIIFFSLIVISGIFRQMNYFFYKDPFEISREIYGSNPFPEAIEIGTFIRERTDKDDTIAVVGSEAEIYFYARRKAATGFIYVYGLGDGHEYNLKFQNEMISEIETKEPEFIVFADVPTSWLFAPGAPTKITDWYKEYTDKYYNLVGVADIVSTEKTIYKWDNEAVNYKPTGFGWLLVYERE